LNNRRSKKGESRVPAIDLNHYNITAPMALLDEIRDNQRLQIERQAEA
jgi:hypothetical protein